MTTTVEAPDRKWPRALALAVTRELLQVLTPLCERVIVAGSLRRKKAEVGDIELLYIPRFVSWPNPASLFHEEIPTNVVDRALEIMLEQGSIEKRLNSEGHTMWGPANKYAVHTVTGVPIDFFATTRESWWNYLVCRTGGARSNTDIASAARERGWQWNPTGPGFTRLSGPDRGRVHTVRSEERR